MLRMSETWNVADEDERGHFLEDDGSQYWEEGGHVTKRWPRIAVSYCVCGYPKDRREDTCGYCVDGVPLKMGRE